MGVRKDNRDGIVDHTKNVIDDRDNLAEYGYAAGSDLDDVGEFLDGRGGLLQRRILLRRELDLNDLLHAARAELDRHADEEVVDPVLPLQEDRAGHDLLLVL